jgi:hypothetical protein
MTWDFSVDVIYEGNQGDIIDQYVPFCHITAEKRRVGGRTKETMMDIINTCIERGVLVDYLRSKTVEAMINLLGTPFEQEQIYQGLLQHREKVGARKNSIETAREMLAGGDMTVATIARYTKLSVAEVEALARGEDIQ